LTFALQHTQHLDYLTGYEPTLEALLKERKVSFQKGPQTVIWELHEADFPSLLTQPSAKAFAKPHVIMFDAFSPAKNPSMWSLPLFTNLYQLLDPQRPCALPTYSRSTILRVTLLLAGFYVGKGHATGEKEETTIAANSAQLIVEPLDRRWLERARRSSSAEPLSEPVYLQAPLSNHTWERLREHPQFK
jgi:tRNA U34 5-methylaminomethyl-2-thiouridine-forming methyltransferase MnmC